MPCRDYEDDRNWVDNDLREQNNKLARISCNALTAFSKANPEELAKFLHSNVEADYWWENHQAADKANNERIAEEKRKNKVKKAALAKLTPEEKKALGL